MTDLLSRDNSVVLETVNADNLACFALFLQYLGAHGYRDWPQDVGQLKDALNQEHFFDHHFLRLLRQQDEVTGYYWVRPERQINRAIVGARGACDGFLLQEAIRVAGTLPITDCVSAFRNHEKYAKQVAATSGFRSEKIYHIMRCTDPVIVHDAILPPGYTLRNLSGLEEADKLCVIQNRAFANHYGYEPNTAESVRKQLVQSGAGCDNVFLVEDASQHIVSYCWCVMQHKDGQCSARISMLGVLPGHRGKDLGWLVCAAAIRQLLQRGITQFELEVDGDNLVAKKIYSRLGFKIVDDIEWMTKSLQTAC